jgi:hypothetical protein
VKEFDVEFNGLDGRVAIIVHVKPTHRFLVRKWIALRLIWLASVLVGAEFEVEDEDEPS